MDGPTDEAIQRAMLKHRHALRQLRHRISTAETSSARASARARYDDRLLQSRELVERRRQALPRIRYDTDLPILAHRQEILQAITAHQVVVVAGETGSGKSTQLPKFCVEAGYGVSGVIGHTQPRRIAARGIAARLCEELECTLGQEVGFKIRFSDRTAETTTIKLMTDGILLAETQHDRFLEEYEVLIIDEAHERSLNIDFLIGYLRRLLSKRPELRVIITSATIDADRFAQHFSDNDAAAPIIRVEGRSYPVTVWYRPWERDAAAPAEDFEGATLAAIHELAAIDEGHILVFLPTERDIRELARRLRGEFPANSGRRGAEILPLYARLSVSEQQRIFRYQAGRRIVLATNVAESSLTVPGIKYVVDTGLARISRYSPRSKVQRLPIEAISRASADQRAGRCGRLEPGICIRLYSEENYLGRKAFGTPEVLRTNLAAVILRALALNLGRVDDFPFLDPPRSDTIQDGYRTLVEIEALDVNRRLTPLGRQLATLPVDPRIARILVAGADEDCLPEILIIAAALEVQDPRDRPHDRQQAADERHAQFADETSDFLGYLKLWDFFHELKRKLTRSQLQKACATNFISFVRMREWSEVHRQLQEMVHEIASGRSFRPAPSVTTQGADEPRSWGHPTSERSAAIHRALLTGFLSGVAYRKTPVEYTGAGGVTFHLWPGSGLFASKPPWCLVSEIVETSRRYGRTAARIDPEMIEPLAEHLVKRQYSDPHWSHKRATVMAYERVTLFGMPIVTRRLVPYGAVDPEGARQIFLQEGLRHDHPLQTSEWAFRETASPTLRADPSAVARFQATDQTRLTKSNDRTDRLAAEPFFRHNQQVLRTAAKLAAKSRRADLLIDEFALFRFYDARIPKDIYDLASLKQWMKQQGATADAALRMRLSDLVALGHEPAAVEGFPDELPVGSMRLPVDYRFAPGDPRDGVTITVPPDGLRQLHDGRTGWLVPGLIEEKVAALLRTLPKSLRTNFIPVPDVARRIAQELQFGVGDFLTELIRCLNGQGSGETVSATDFDLGKLPPHLTLNIRVVDDQGQTVLEGRDPSDLLARLGLEQSAEVFGNQEAPWHRDGISHWDFEDLPPEITLHRGEIAIAAYPTLVDDGNTVQLRLYDQQLAAQRALRTGLRRLYSLSQKRALRSQLSWMPRFQELALWAQGLIAADRLRDQIRDRIADRAFLPEDQPLPRTRSAFEERLVNAVERINLATQDVVKLLPVLCQRYHEFRLKWEAVQGTACPLILGDLDRQIRNLCPDGFLVTTSWHWLAQFPRLLQGMILRLDRVPRKALPKEEVLMQELGAFWHEYLKRRGQRDKAGVEDPELEQFRWMIEEYRISLFAQTLGTSLSVSSARLQKQLEKCQR